MPTRRDVILPLIQDKDVLDIGSAGFKKSDVFFRFIKEHSRFVQGLELDPELVKKCHEDNIICADAEEFISKRKFDVVIAGELIEHLSNPGRFLDCSYANLKDQGTLILTTPNPYSLQNIVRALFLGKEARCKGHLALYSETTIKELLCRHKFSQVDVSYVDRYTFSGIKGVLEFMVCLLFKHRRPTMAIIAKKGDG